MRILIVDDALADRQALRHILACEGHFVLCAENGEEALLRALEQQPDLVLMDVNMPDLDGFATMRRMKADAATKDIPVVFITGKNRKSDLAWGRLLGARGFMAKPYTREEVLAQVVA